MKILFFTAAAAALFSTTLMAADQASPLYEMRTYYATPGKLNDLHDRFRHHTVRLFEKHGMTNVGYFVPVNNEENKLVFVLSYPNRQAREESWKAFLADPDWQAAYRKSNENGPIMHGDRIESIFLQTTDYSPTPKIEQKGERIFELRTYTTPEGKLPNLNTRFRDHTVGLFKKHGMENIIYWTKTPGQPGADTTLIYFLAHKDAEAHRAAFDAFRQDPDWIKARTESERGGSLTAQGGVKSELMVPTDYSPLK